MGTTTSRRCKDGTEGHTAQIRIKRDGKITHQKAQTFDRLPVARLRLKQREVALAEPGALVAVKLINLQLSKVIVQYLMVRAFGITGVCAVGFMIIASCPTDRTSNILTHLARGDVALAVSITAVAA